MLFDPGCVVCQERSGPVCTVCESVLRRAGPVPIVGPDHSVAGFELDEGARTIIAAFKYHRQRRLARWLAATLGELVPRAADVITWVPATPERRRSRGFDQGEELARALARATGLPAQRLLVRHGGDTRQTGLSRLDRIAGPQLAARTTMTGAHEFVVLIDDVITTGSSMRVGAEALKTAGASRVVAVAAAATPIHRDHSLRDLTIASRIPGWT